MAIERAVDKRNAATVLSGMSLSNAPLATPLSRLRPQIQDLTIENIADLAARASTLQDVIPLWYGEGDLVTPDFIRDACKQSLDAGETFYVPDMHGTARLRASLSAYQTRLYRRDIAPDRTTVTPGGMQSVLLALELIADAGSNVVLLEPQWPNIARAVHLVGAEPRPVPMVPGPDGWALDLDRVAARCDARTRAVALSTPSNPSGWTATRAELQALLGLCRARGIWLLTDEVYARLYFGPENGGTVAPSALQIAEPDDLVMCINSFSKAWAMTGLRVGWLNHPASIATRVSAMTQYMTSGVAAVLQAGAAAALDEGEPFVAQMRERCRAGLDLAYERLSRIGRIELLPKPVGGMYVFFRLRGEPDSRAACHAVLERARVGLAPGYLFGDSSAAFMRMCICRDPAQLGTALDRMAAALDAA